MLLAVDVGNTQTALCIFRETELVDHWRLATERSSTADELGVLLGGQPRQRVEDGGVLDRGGEHATPTRVGGTPRPLAATTASTAAPNPCSRSDVAYSGPMLVR